MVEADHGAARGFRDHVAVDQRGAGARYDGHADADKAVADDVAGDGDIAQIFAPAGDDAEGGRVLNDIAGDGSVSLDIDADTGVIVRRGADRALRHEIADDIALNDSNAAAFVEIADGEAEYYVIEGYVGDSHTL